MNVSFVLGKTPSSIWRDMPSGASIHMDRFYGFIDSGGLAGAFTGYTSKREAYLDIIRNHNPGNIQVGTYPHELGDMAVCVLSGLEYINRLLCVCDEEQEFNDYGYWA